jgi:hypothetical protein
MPADRPETDVSARPWTPESRDALLSRVTAITTGTAVAGCVGALGLAVGLAATVNASPSTSAAGATKPAPRSAPAAPSSPEAPATSGDVAAADIKVEVLNGVGIAGAARLVAQQLTDAGFDVVATGNTNGRVRASGIIYAPGQAAAFRTLSTATGVALSSDQGSSATLVLVIGPDWQGDLPAAQSNQGQSSNGFAQPPSAPQGRSSNGGGSNATSGGS